MAIKHTILSSLLSIALLTSAAPATALAANSPAALTAAGASSLSALSDSGPAIEVQVTRGQFISSIIRASGLNLDHIRFIKAPDVRDVAPDVSPEASFAGDLIIAGHYGVVKSGEPFRPEDPVTREEAALMAVKALDARAGKLPVTLQFIIFEDQEKIDRGNMESIQYACKLGLFGAEKTFRPGDTLTGSEQSRLLPAFKKILGSVPDQDGVTWELSPDGKSITLFWGEKPTGGYAINIVSVVGAGNTLKVFYSLRSPGPGDLVTQAFTYPRATAALPAGTEPFTKVQLARAEGNYRILFNIGNPTYTDGGINYKMDASPFLENGRAMVPVRYLALSLGVPEDRISWSPSSRTVTLVKEGTTIVLAAGGSIMYVNDRPVQMNAAPVLRQGRVYLPARYVAEALGCTVEWNTGEQAVLISPSSPDQN